MADMFVPFNESDEEMLEKSIAAELSKNDDIVEYIHENSLEALKNRFSSADEDENIRNEGFGLAKKGGLIRKPHPDSIMPYMNREIPPKEDIPTDSESDLSKMFDMAKSEHDSDNVMFSDLGNDSAKAEEEKPKEEVQEKPAEPVEETPKDPPKRKRGRPRKNPLPEEASEKKEKKEAKNEEAPAEKAPENNDSNEQYVLTPKYNTNTKIIYVNENLDDGIKRNSESELENLFSNERKGKVFGLWRKIKK